MSEEVLSRQRKEIKALEGEKRATLKKIKGTKGKKGKELVAATEAEYKQKLEDLQKKHQEELGAGGDNGGEPEAQAPENVQEETRTEEELARERKQAKARRKREKAKQAELDRQARIEEETRNAGPSARQIELEQMQTLLGKKSLLIIEVPSDGNCLYRAVAAQCPGVAGYEEIRSKCADSLQTHQEDFAAFMEYTDSVPDYEAYVERVRNSSDWGGHLELRALSLALKRTIEVYSTNHEPLVLGHENDENDEREPIRLSYHLHYYALGEHYNQVAPLSVGDKEEEEA